MSSEVACGCACSSCLGRLAKAGPFCGLQAEYMYNQLVCLKERIDDCEDLINIELDSRCVQNHTSQQPSALSPAYLSRTLDMSASDAQTSVVMCTFQA